MKPESRDRRDRVLRYPDLAARLTQPPLNYRRPEDWQGWIPPEALEVEACRHCREDPGQWGCRRPQHTARINNSVRRTELVAIVAEADRRAETEAGSTSARLEDPATCSS
jgi:hypothetical protein